MRRFIFDSALLIGIGYLLIGNHPAVVECVNKLTADWQAFSAAVHANTCTPHLEERPFSFTRLISEMALVFSFVMGVGVVAFAIGTIAGIAERLNGDEKSI